MPPHTTTQPGYLVKERAGIVKESKTAGEREAPRCIGTSYRRKNYVPVVLPLRLQKLLLTNM